jgi:hypothetical protein
MINITLDKWNVSLRLANIDEIARIISMYFHHVDSLSKYIEAKQRTTSVLSF